MIGCWCIPRLHEPQLVYLYNRFLWKPWYRSGQLEVCFLMSALRPQMGVCATDRRLCSVSDWGLGLVTGPEFYRLASPLPRSHAHTGKVRGWDGGTDWVPGWLSGLLAVTENTQRSRGPHTHMCTHIHTGAHPAWCPLSCHVSAALTASAVAALPKSLSDSLFYLFLPSSRRPNVECVIRIQQDLIGFYRTC